MDRQKLRGKESDSKREGGGEKEIESQREIKRERGRKR